jgi:hypothetical protein
MAPRPLGVEALPDGRERAREISVRLLGQREAPPQEAVALVRDSR